VLETRTVSLKTAIAIIVVCTAAFITLGISVGYAKYWDLDENAHLDSGRTYYRQGTGHRRNIKKPSVWIKTISKPCIISG